MTILMILAAFVIGYWVGRRVGVAQTMLRLERIIADLQQIEYTFKMRKQQWNEDNL